MEAMTSGAGEPLWNVKDVALYLRASKSWVYKAAEKNLIPSVRVGALLRFNPEAIRDQFKNSVGEGRP